MVITGQNWPPRMWNMMFNHVQLMPNPLGVAENAYGQILQFWAKKGRFWALLGPKKTFSGVPNGHNWPPRVRDMMFNHVQPMFNQFGVAEIAYGHFWPKRVIFGWFRGPQMPFLRAKRVQTHPPPDVKYNVQPCSTNVQPIWGCWDCLWPNMAILGHKSHKITTKYGLWRPPRFKKGPSTFHYPNLAARHLKELS